MLVCRRWNVSALGGPIVETVIDKQMGIENFAADPSYRKYSVLTSVYDEHGHRIAEPIRSIAISKGIITEIMTRCIIFGHIVLFLLKFFF